MSQEYIEITERTVSEAITAACQKLAVPSERLEYEVIDPGKTGFLGICSRAAKIRARVKQGMDDSAEFDTSAIISDVLKGKDDKKKSSDQRPKEKRKDERKEAKKKDNSKNTDKSSARKSDQAAEKSPVKEESAETALQTPKETPVSEEKKTPANNDSAARDKAETSEGNAVHRKGSGRKDSSEKSFEKGNRGRGRRRQRRNDRDENAAASRDHEQERSFSSSENHVSPKKRSAVPVLTDEQVEEVKQRAETFLADVFQAMNLDAKVSSSYDRETGMLTIDMKGENMGVLIGKRGQTLDSLQYLVSLVVNKGIEGYIHVKADTENYRERRKKTLENLAKNIAVKVKRNRSSVALEPMNPYERRIIHSALQGDRYVTTYSEGEEPYRKVIVTMKEDR
jgi:spoIIIJ-associated protein